jgi:predicted dehydrogenase
MMLKIGLIGTSWWVDSMYLPALASHKGAEIVAICGRDKAKAELRAADWNIPHVFSDVDAFLASPLDAVIIASSNDTHYEFAMKALAKGLHVLCEKPLSLSYPQAVDMYELAQKKGVNHMTPFTYSYMPTARYLKELIDSGYIGQPYHLNMRYYTGFGREEGYVWRFDADKAGSGALGDIGSHFIYIAIMLFGDITGVFAKLGKHLKRPKLNPEGKTYTQADDNVFLTLQFANGALGSIQASTLALEETPFGQIHQMEFHGSKGSLHSYTDWDKIQQVSGSSLGSGPTQPLEIPEHIWNGVRRDTVHNTYKDVFRTQNLMARAFVRDILAARPSKPDFNDGAKVQKIIAAALKSDLEGCWVNLADL